jgi:hypothetical protein
VSETQRQLVAALHGRVQSATLAARLTPRESELLITLSEQLREGKLPVQCASCQRLHVDGEWWSVPNEPLVTSFITGIAIQRRCPDCSGRVAAATLKQV